MQDSEAYLARKNFVKQLLTIYGRKPCLEALSDPQISSYRLHLADSNKKAKILDEIIQLADQREVEIVYHDRKALSRISKNGKQDQGVALDLMLKGFIEHEDYLQAFTPNNQEFIALDRITNPQNLGMIIRSVCASPLTGLILPRQGCARIDALVIKACAGTLFKSRVVRCDDLETCLNAFADKGTQIVGLDSNAKQSFAETENHSPTIYVLGNETDGLSPTTEKLCNKKLKIPMANNVESLNVAVTASLIAFRSVMGK